MPDAQRSKFPEIEWRREFVAVSVLRFASRAWPKQWQWHSAPGGRKTPAALVPARGRQYLYRPPTPT